MEHIPIFATNEAFRERISGHDHPLQGVCHYRMMWLDVPTNRRFYRSIQCSIGHSVVLAVG